MSLFRHSDFKDFLRHFGKIVSLFRTGDDIVYVLERHLRRLKAQGCAYAEFRVSPSVWEHFGLDAERTLKKVLGFQFSGVRFNFIIEAVRHWEKELIERDLERAIRHKGVVKGFGLGGDEIAAPVGGFSWLAGECRRNGIDFIPHAGEVSGPSEVLAAAEMGAKRIGHGIGAADDGSLCEILKKERIHLEVCPTSNFKTGAVKEGDGHPLRVLWERGVPFSVSTDDPGLFLTSLPREVRLASRITASGEPGIAAFQREALEASLLDKTEKENLGKAFLS